MRMTRWIPGLLVAMLFSVTPAFAGEVVDQVVAVVNQKWGVVGCKF